MTRSRHDRLKALACAALIALAAPFPGAGPAFAQETAPAPTEAVEEPAAPEEDGETAAPVRTPDTPYDGRLVRLSEIVGSVHYLSTLCRPAEASEDDTAEPSVPDAVETGDWRRMMQALIAAETPEADRRARLTAAFNRGYRSFASVYTGCTPAAEAAATRYRSEGATLAAEIIARFGN